MQSFNAIFSFKTEFHVSTVTVTFLLLLPYNIAGVHDEVAR